MTFWINIGNVLQEEKEDTRMKKRKAFLAKVLAAAIAVTTVLPGAMTAQAAGMIAATTSRENAQTADTWSQEFGEGNVGGQPTWHLKSGVNNNNVNTDYSTAEAPAVILDTKQDMTFVEGQTKSFSVDLYPNGTIADMRFGIMLKYVDATHWAYLGYDQGASSKWFLEYNTGTSSYPSVSGLADLEDNKYTKIEVTYTANNAVAVKVTPEGGTATEATIDDTSVTGAGAALEALETYAATAGENQGKVPIRMGFKAGYYNNAATDMNLKDLTVNGAVTAFGDFEWVKVRTTGEDGNVVESEREGQIFEEGDIVGGVDYAVLAVGEAQGTVATSDSSLTDFMNGTVSAVIRPQAENQKFALAAKYTDAGAVKVGFDGAKWYYTVGDATTPIEDAAALAKDTDYTLSMAFAGGKLSASVIAVDAAEGTEATALASDVDVAAVAAGSIAFETEGADLWVRNVSYTKKTLSEPTELSQAVATVKTAKGENNDANEYYTEQWTAYAEALSAAQQFLDGDEEKTASEVATLKSNLETKANAMKKVTESSEYTTLKNLYDGVKDDVQGYYDDASWKTFTDARDAAKAVIDKAGKEALTVANVTGAANTLTTAKNGRTERPATTEEKADLQAGYDKVKDTENKCYTEASWTTFTNALAAAEEALKSDTANNTEVAAKLAALNTAFEGLTQVPASAEVLEGLQKDYTSEKAVVNDNYTKESWDAFQAALKNVEAVIAKGEAVTQYEVQDVLAKLQAAKNALKKAAPADDNKTPDNNTNTKPETKIPAVGETTVLKGVTYKVTKSDAANGTVSVSKADKSVKKVTIPSTVKIGEVTFKVTAVNAKVFAGCKKLTSVTVGANVTSIGKQAFSKCAKLKKVIFKGTKAPKIGAKAFQKTAKKCVVTTPKKMAKKQLTKLKTSLKKAGMKSASYKKK